MRNKESYQRIDLLFVNAVISPMVEPLPDAELAKLVEKSRELYSKNKSETHPDTQAMAKIESIYALKNSSNRLERLTYILIFFTIILAILTVALLMK